jgi:hypothetical protein
MISSPRQIANGGPIPPLVVLLLTLAVTLLNPACAAGQQVFIDPQVYIHPDRQARIPEEVGLHIPAELKEYRHAFQQKTAFYAATGDIELGRILSLAMYNVLASSFRGLRFVNDYSPGRPLSGTGIRLIAVPEMVTFRFVAPSTNLSPYLAHVVLGWVFYGADGAALHRLRASGESSYGMGEMIRDGSGFSFAKRGLSPYQIMQGTITAAIETALQRLAEQIVLEREKILSLYPPQPRAEQGRTGP